MESGKSCFLIPGVHLQIHAIVGFSFFAQICLMILKNFLTFAKHGALKINSAQLVPCWKTDSVQCVKTASQYHIQSLLSEPNQTPAQALSGVGMAVPFLPACRPPGVGGATCPRPVSSGPSANPVGAAAVALSWSCCPGPAGQASSSAVFRYR